MWSLGEKGQLVQWGPLAQERPQVLGIVRSLLQLLLLMVVEKAEQMGSRLAPGSSPLYRPFSLITADGCVWERARDRER